MPELGEELRLLADQGAHQANPTSPAEVMRCGDRRRRRRALRDGFGAIAVAGAVAVGIVSVTPPGQHATLHHPETRPPTPMPSPVPSPTAPTPSPAPRDLRTTPPSPSPSSAPGGPTSTPSPSQSPSPYPTGARSPSPAASPSPNPEPSPGAS